VPDISAFEFTKPIAKFPAAQTTTNYQFGSVFYADNITADADIYYIDSSNTIQSVKGNGSNGCPNGDSCEINGGPVIYKGVEGEATYTFDAEQLNGWLDGLAMFGNGSINAARVHVNPTPDATHIGLGQAYQDKQAPFWTAAGGLIYKHNGWKLSFIDKATGQQYEDSPSGRVDSAGNPIWIPDPVTHQMIKNPAYSGQSFYKIGAFNILDFTGSYDFGEEFDADWEIGGGVYNILDQRDIVSVTINDSPPKDGGAGSVENFAARGDSLDQYYFAPSRSFQVNVKARF
jgi:iron complex outermembrane receptor protein